jgi:hypothetical protein
MYSIKVEKVDNNAIFDVSDEFQVEELTTETIALTLNRAGNISNLKPFPTVFTDGTGNGLSNQANNTFPMFLQDQPPNVYNVRGFFYMDMGSVTNQVIAGKLYMKFRPSPDMAPIKESYLFIGTQPKAGGFSGVSDYSSFTTQLSTKSQKIGDYVVFTLNEAGVAELTTKGTQSFCIRNEYDVEVKPVTINDTSGFTLINSYFELKTT